MTDNISDMPPLAEVVTGSEELTLTRTEKNKVPKVTMLGRGNRLWNSLKKMRLLWFNIVLVSVCVIATGVAAGEIKNRNVDTDNLIAGDYKKEITKLIQTHLNLSLKYLYTGVGFGSHLVQRPGMAKYLRELSDSHWEEGIDVLKKYFQRGGKTENFFNYQNFNFKGENHLKMSPDMHVPYGEFLVEMHKDSKYFASSLNELHKMVVGQNAVHHDGDWGHYFEEKLEKEEERTRKMKGHLTTLQQMSKSGLALNTFDSNL